MHNNYKISISCGHISTSYNEIGKCVINGFSDKINGRLKISIMDIKLCEFLHKFKMATLDQINRYFEVIGCNKNWSYRLDKLNKSYNLINEIKLHNEKNEDIICYTLDIGGMYLLNNYSNEDINPRVDDLTSQRKTFDSIFQIHPYSVIKSLVCTEVYLNKLNESNIVNMENRFRIREYMILTDSEKECGKSPFLNLKIDLMLNIDQTIETAYFIKVIIDDEIEKICLDIDKFNMFKVNRCYIDKYCSLDVKSVKLNLVFTNDEYMRIVEAGLRYRGINLADIVLTNMKFMIDNSKSINGVAI
ncbi:hypothetical protein [Romboutsia sp. 1001713B170207_170306_H8]|uniref:hypothetical protein n=1 Tax=Romboutsia sp. 1001713B170207_170306_H8 TaxID=2787112 RepID=UPI0018990974|nr:hypothetical protein [Romboutsia sp. 1001713B170207_170306_H8]